MKEKVRRGSTVSPCNTWYCWQVQIQQLGAFQETTDTQALSCEYKGWVSNFWTLFYFGIKKCRNKIAFLQCCVNSSFEDILQKKTLSKYWHILIRFDLRFQGPAFLFDQQEEGEDFHFAFSSKSPQATKDDSKEDFQFPFNFWVCKI